jgi:glycosyltransferase involved in cell wall biosynthesis
VHVFFSAVAQADWRARALETTIDGVRVSVVPNAALSDPRFRRLQSLQARRLLGAAYALVRAFQDSYDGESFDVVQAPTLLPVALLLDDRCPMLLRCSGYGPWWREADEIEASSDDALVEAWELESLHATPFVYAPSAFLATGLRNLLAIPCSVLRPPLEPGQSGVERDWAAAQVEPGETTLLWLGSLARRKGSKEGAAAFARALDREPTLRLHVCGGDQGGLVDFDALPAPVRARMVMHGPQPAARAHALLERSAALVAPSRIENLSNSVIEAHSLGVPAIVCDGTSSEELWPDALRPMLPVVGDVAGVARLIAESRDARPAHAPRLLDHVRALLDVPSALSSFEAFARQARAQPTVRGRNRETALAEIVRMAEQSLATPMLGSTARARVDGVVRSLEGRAYRELWIWGAGDTNRLVVHELDRLGTAVAGVVDVDETRHGELWGRWRIDAPIFPDRPGMLVVPPTRPAEYIVRSAVERLNRDREHALSVIEPFERNGPYRASKDGSLTRDAASGES